MRIFGIERVQLRQPEVKQPVIELKVTNAFGRWMHEKNWAGATIPVFGFVLIFYWVEVQPLNRVHEFHHVRQFEETGNLLGHYVKYLTEHFRSGYAQNRFELEAYEVERKAAQEGLPDWARE